MNNFFSLIILLGDEEALKRIDDLQRQITAAFGGGSTLQLPPHITLVRWQGTASMASCVSAEVSKHHAIIPIILEGLEAVPAAKSVWFRVRPSAELSILIDAICRVVVECGGLVDSRERILHLTLAYKDYDADEILRLGNFIGAKHTERVAGRELVLCQRSDNGSWSIYHHAA